MGQQQLLLIVLGVIIVGIAVVVGINVFSASSYQANIDGLNNDLVQLGSMAQQYYRKPTALGGGGNAFTGWSLPAALDTTGNGDYNATVAANQVTIVGTGVEAATSGGGNVQVTATITPDNIQTSITRQ